MKRTFFVLYIILFLSSCEDDINSPDYNDNTLGCPDPVACNFSPLANINDGSCIYGLPDSVECLAFDDCQLNSDNLWVNHTCLDLDGYPFVSWNGSESSCGYLHQNAGFIFQDGGYIYQEAINGGEPCENLTESGCDEACAWNADSQICELAYVCEDDNGVSLLNWNRESISAEDDCNNASICVNNLGESLEGWSFSSSTQNECESYSVCLDSAGTNWSAWDSNSQDAENECNIEYQYTPGSCEDNNEDDGGSDDAGADDGGNDG